MESASFLLGNNIRRRAGHINQQKQAKHHGTTERLLDIYVAVPYANNGFRSLSENVTGDIAGPSVFSPYKKRIPSLSANLCLVPNSKIFGVVI